MAASLFNSSDRLKELLHIWRDTDAAAYIKQKQKLFQGLIVTASIHERYLPLIFENSKTHKSYHGSLLRNIFGKVFAVSSSADRFINRAVFNRIHLFSDDIIIFKITSKFGEMVMCGSFDDNFHDEDISTVFPKGVYGKKDWTEIKIELQMMNPGYSRLKFEEFNGFTTQENLFINLDKYAVQEFTSWNQTMSPAWSERRLQFLSATHPQEIKLKGINLKNKNIAYLYLLIKELTEKQQWYKTNEDCIRKADRKFYIYDRELSKFLRMIDLQVIKLGRISEF